MTDEERPKMPRVVCPFCGRTVTARQDGSPRSHYPPADVAIAGAGRLLQCKGGYRNGIYSQKTMTYAEFGKLEFWCPLCGSPVNVGSVDVTNRYDRQPMVRVGRYECTRRGCEHGPPVVDGCDG